jgi:hypothetical protein
MEIKNKIPLKCAKCGGAKYIDEPYLIYDTWFVDVVCIICSHSKDIEVDRLNQLLAKLEGSMKNAE